MECTLSTRFSCQCPNCVVGGAVTVDKSKDEHTYDSFSLFFTTTTSSTSTSTNTTTMNPDDSTENIDNNQGLSVSSTASFPLITLPQSSSSSVSASTSTSISTEQEQAEQEQAHQRRLAKKLKWEKKLRRLNFLERASFTSCSGIKNPRRYFSELGNEYYEIFNIEKPTALSQKVVTASKTGIFYPKRSETLRSLARRNYTLRGAGMSHFNTAGVPEHMQLHAPFSSRNSHSSTSFDGPHYGKFDDRGVKNYEKKCLHHRDDKSGYIAKQKIKKEERKKKREEEESEQETFDDEENEEETEETKEEVDDDCDDEWDDEIRGWLYIGHNERLRRGLIGEKATSSNNNNSKMHRRKSKKSGKYSLWEDDLYDREFYLRP